MLLDDELPGLSYLKILCEQIPDLEVVRAFDNPIQFIQEVPTIDFDFCILDIEMPDMNGLQIAQMLNGKPVIFATAYKDYAAEAFDMNALDYIRKPIKIDRLKQAIDKANKYFSKSWNNHKKNFIQLNTNQGKSIVYFDHIAYISTSNSDSRDKSLRFFDGKELVLKNITFDKIKELLPSKDFCRVNKKELISLKVIHSFSFDEITTNLMNKEGKIIRLSLGENYKTEFLQKVNI